MCINLPPSSRRVFICCNRHCGQVRFWQIRSSRAPETPAACRVTWPWSRYGTASCHRCEADSRRLVAKTRKHPSRSPLIRVLDPERRCVFWHVAICYRPDPSEPFPSGVDDATDELTPDPNSLPFSPRMRALFAQR